MMLSGAHAAPAAAPAAEDTPADTDADDIPRDHEPPRTSPARVIMCALHEDAPPEEE